MGWSGVLKRRDGMARIGLAVLVILISVSSISTLTAPRTSAAGGRSVKQAFFYVPPTDGTSTGTLAERSNLIILTQGQEGYRNQVRSQGFAGDVLQYIVAAEVEGPGPYANSSAACDASFDPLSNQVADQVGDFCSRIHPNEGWFLHNGAGKRIYGYWDGRLYYHMNPANAGWRAFALERMRADLTSLGFDGIFLDNVNLTMYKTRYQLSNSDGTIKEFGSDSAYRAAWTGYLSQLSGGLRSTGALWGNMVSDPNTGSSWDDYLQHLDGGMFEAFATGYDGLSSTRWNNNLRQTEAALAAGKGVLMVGRGTKSDTTKQTFALASYLLVSRGSDAFFRYGNSGSYGQWWQYANYDVEFGTPAGKRYQDGAIWRRDFDCGYVTVEPAARIGKIVETACGSVAPDPPEVSLTGVLDGATVIGEIHVEAVVASSTSVREVEFFLDGQSIDTEGVAPFFLGGDNSGQPLGIDTRAWSEGAHELKAVATDSGGLTGAASVSITVANNVPTATRPTIQLNGISANQVVSGTINVRAIVTSAVGIKEVRFVLNSRVADVEYVGPFWLGGDSGGVPDGFDTRVWPNGSQTFRAKVFDNAGMWNSVTFTIVVRN